jgi:hypothetical protein
LVVARTQKTGLARTAAPGIPEQLRALDQGWLLVVEHACFSAAAFKNVTLTAMAAE